MEFEFMSADTVLPPCMPLPAAMLRLPISSTAKVMYARLLNTTLIASLEALLTGIDQTSINQALAKEYSDHITDNERRLEQVLEFKARLYESLVGGMLTKEEYASYKAKYTKQAEDIRESVRVLKEKLTEVLENRSERNRWISQFTQFSTLETLDRRALIHMVQSIRVRGKKELDITFTHEDEYKKALQLLALAAQQKDYEQRKVG